LKTAKKSAATGSALKGKATEKESTLDESEVSLLQAKLKSLREENIDINREYRETKRENEFLEKNLIEVKMQWATLDHENEEIALKLK
jgi:hypothetical protein